MRIIFLLLTVLVFAACQRERQMAPAQTVKSATLTTAAKADTIPDKAALKVKLFKDNTAYDETMVIFNHLAKTNYDFHEDAVYLVGFGQVSLASISADGRDLAINSLPYTLAMPVSLDVRTKNDGIFYLGLSYENQIPPTIAVWIKDELLKDSADLRRGNYAFTISRTDTNSFGSKRFELVLRSK
jgi:hypothetical protein